MPCGKARTGRLAATVAKLLHTPTAVARIVEISAEPFIKIVDVGSAEYYLCRKCLAGRSRSSDTGDWRFNKCVGCGANRLGPHQWHVPNVNRRFYIFCCSQKVDYVLRVRKRTGQFIVIPQPRRGVTWATLPFQTLPDVRSQIVGGYCGYLPCHRIRRAANQRLGCTLGTADPQRVHTEDLASRRNVPRT